MREKKKVDLKKKKTGKVNLEKKDRSQIEKS